jgi:hypothetical protein
MQRLTWSGTALHGGKDVVTQPGQFEPWTTRREEMQKLSLDDPRDRNAAQIADAVLTGQIPDPTAGATSILRSFGRDAVVRLGAGRGAVNRKAYLLRVRWLCSAAAIRRHA